MISSLDTAVFDRHFDATVLASEDGCPIACWTSGPADAPALVLLHGFALDHTVWSALCASAALRSRFRIVVPDLRGHGRSGQPPVADGYTGGAAWAADLAVVLREFDLVDPTVVAWSFGGRSVLDYARRYGTDALHGIVFVAAAAQAHFASLGPDHVLLEAVCSSDPAVLEPATDAFIERVLHVAAHSPAATALRAAMAGSTPQVRTWMRGRALDYDALIAQLDLPVMWINGMEDPIVLPSRVAAFTEVLPQARISLYESCRHAPFMEAPERFADELLQFCDNPPPYPRKTPVSA